MRYDLHKSTPNPKSLNTLPQKVWEGRGSPPTESVLKIPNAQESPQNNYS
jgi:hypothetical protein